MKLQQASTACCHFMSAWIAQPHQAVMGCHQRMLAAQGDDDTQTAPDMLDTLFECQGRDREVVQYRWGWSDINGY